MESVLSTATATIAASSSLSGAIDCSAGRPTMIHMPSGWDAASLTFQVSPDNSTWNKLTDSSGNEYTVTAAASTSIILPIADFVSVRYLKIRSGTASSAVNQTAARTLTVELVP